MMHSDSDQQVMQLTSWFQKYGKWIVGLIVVVMIAIGGMQYLRSHRQSELNEAAATFTDLVAKLDPNKSETIVALVDFAKKENNSYGIFASLKAAQWYVMQDKAYEKATSLLTDALSKTHEEALQDILLLRIARLQLQQHLLEDSLKTLAQVKSEGWQSMVNRVRGDVYLKQKRYEDSIDAYQFALASAINEDTKATLEMKLNHAQYLMQKAGTQSETSKKSTS